MPGAKIPVLEIENLFLSDDGRGLIVYNDGTNFYKGRVWTGIPPSSLSTKAKGFAAASSSGWLKVHMISSSTYGPTGATYYIPIYSSLDINTSV